MLVAPPYTLSFRTVIRLCQAAGEREATLHKAFVLCILVGHAGRLYVKGGLDWYPGSVCRKTSRKDDTPPFVLSHCTLRESMIAYNALHPVLIFTY